MNAALVGRSYPPVVLELGADRVAAFAAAVGHPWRGVPPTFAVVLEQAAGLENVVADAELGLDFARVVHGEQVYEWARPLVVGETVTATSTIDDIRLKGALERLTLRTELRDAAGRVVVVARCVLIVRNGA